MVRLNYLAFWCVLFITIINAKTLLSQSDFAINKLLIPAIEDGWMEVSEAEIVRIHLMQYGWPVVPEEAWAIHNIRPEVSHTLSKDLRWRLWCEWAKEESSTSKINSQPNPIKWNVTGMGDFNTGEYDFEGSKIGCVGRIRSNNWGAVIERDAGEVGIDFIGGYVNGQAGNGVNWIVGDHRIHWGAGATISRYDPFQSMRAPHRLGQISRDFDGVYSGDGSPMRRGVAIRKNFGNWWFASSFDSRKRDYSFNSISGLSWFETGLHRTENEIQRESAKVRRLAFAAFSKSNYWSNAISLGFVGEVGQSLNQTWTGVVGGVFRLEKDALSMESEIGFFKSGIIMRNRAVLTANQNLFLFCVFDRENEFHPGRNWGAKSSSETKWVGNIGASWGPMNRNLVLLTNIENGFASFKASLIQNTHKDCWIDLQSRLKLYVNDDGSIEFGGRLRWDLGIMRFSGEFAKSGQGLYGWGRALRVDVKGVRPITLAVMNGVNQMEGRLYSLLPTARGYRLFSVGDNTYRAIITCEIVPDRVVVSLEKVWPDGGHTHSSHRISIRLEGR